MSSPATKVVLFRYGLYSPYCQNGVVVVHWKRATRNYAEYEDHVVRAISAYRVRAYTRRDLAPQVPPMQTLHLQNGHSSLNKLPSKCSSSHDANYIILWRHAVAPMHFPYQCTAPSPYVDAHESVQQTRRAF